MLALVGADLVPEGFGWVLRGFARWAAVGASWAPRVLGGCCGDSPGGRLVRRVGVAFFVAEGCASGRLVGAPRFGRVWQGVASWAAVGACAAWLAPRSLCLVAFAAHRASHSLQNVARAYSARRVACTEELAPRSLRRVV